jgi:hypothetical protein
MNRRTLWNVVLTLGGVVAFVGSGFVPVARICVVNESALPLNHVTVEGRCIHKYQNDLPVGESTTFWALSCGETSLRLSFATERTAVDSSGHGYVSAPPPNGTLLRVSPDLSVHDEIDGGWVFLLVPRRARKWLML